MSMRRALLVLLLLAGLAIVPAWAGSQARIVRLSLVNGPVQIDRATGQGFEKAIANMPITQGMKLRTDANSRAEVEFENGTTLRLAASAAVDFPELSLRSDGLRVSTVRVDGGTVYMNIRHKKEDDLRVQFTGRELALDHSARFRLKVENDEAQIAVFKGELKMNGPVEQAKVKKNETLTLDLRDQQKYQLAKGISPEATDTWDANRIEYQEYYASNYGRSPYSYGRSDLNYYGNWSYIPGYGNVWQPAGMGYGWDPFSNGYWAWYPGFGYTFVSGYPWGWTPYRYGSWVFVGSRGWCWRPGGWNTWRTLPPVNNPPLAFVPPTPPAGVTGGGTPAPPTVIVTRGPRHIKPEPDARTAGPGNRLPVIDGAAPVVRSAPVGTMSAAPATSAPTPPPPATSQRGARVVPGPDGPVMRSPSMRDPDSAFRGGRPMRGQADNMQRPNRSGASAPASAPAPRVSAPASAPRVSPPAPAASRPARSDSKASPH